MRNYCHLNKLSLFSSVTRQPGSLFFFCLFFFLCMLVLLVFLTMVVLFNTFSRARLYTFSLLIKLVYNTLFPAAVQWNQHESSRRCCPVKHAFCQSSWLSNWSAMLNDLFYRMCLKCFFLLHQQLEAELHNSWQQLSSLQSHCSDLEDQLSSKEKEAAAKDAQLSQLQYGENVTL